MGHPNKESFSSSLADADADGARSTEAEVRILNPCELEFEPILWKGYKEVQELEPDLIKAQESIIWADHLAFSYPIWWATPPVLLKGSIDRVLIPGFAFQSSVKNKLPEKLLTGKTAHLIVTMDSPSLYYRWFIGAPGHNMMKKGTLEFCGIKPVRITEFSPSKTSTTEQRIKWLEKSNEKGRKLI